MTRRDAQCGKGSIASHVVSVRDTRERAPSVTVDDFLRAARRSVPRARGVNQIAGGRHFMLVFSFEVRPHELTKEFGPVAGALPAGMTHDIVDHRCFPISSADVWHSVASRTDRKRTARASVH